MLKHLIENGTVKPLGLMQVVTRVADMDPTTDDQKETKVVPSMLHHVDKSDLQKYSLEQVFTSLAQEETR